MDYIRLQHLGQEHLYKDILIIECLKLYPRARRFQLECKNIKQLKELIGGY